MLASNGSVHADKGLGSGKNGFEFQSGRVTPYGVT